MKKGDPNGRPFYITSSIDSLSEINKPKETRAASHSLVNSHLQSPPLNLPKPLNQKSWISFYNALTFYLFVIKMPSVFAVYMYTLSCRYGPQ
jgi:hypothetical protein